MRKSERVTCGDADDLLDDGVLRLLVLTPAPGVLLVDGAQFAADVWQRVR